MTTSQIPYLYEIIHGEVIPPGKRAYFQERLRNRLYNLILGEFVHKKNLSQKTLAYRIGKGPDQINRWLSSPGNWTLDTVSDLLLGICGAELNPSINRLTDQMITCNAYGPEWLSKENTTATETNYIQTVTTSNVVQLIPKPVATTIPHRYPFPVNFGTL
jgi:hypothetical protein